ncbi:hypothetical protein FQR65_LT07994 [Abscondita terminalis]|nr:hypothetical protein FQR65_LT07994 [Abscondita terminalis]
MRIRLIISEPDSANSSTIGCSVETAKLDAAPHNCSRSAPTEAANASSPTSTIEVGIGVAFEMLDLARAADNASAVMLKRASRDTPAKPRTVGDQRRRHAERDHVSQRIELAPHGRAFLAPARHAPVEHIETPAPPAPSAQANAPTPQTALPSVNQSARWNSRIIGEAFGGRSHGCIMKRWPRAPPELRACIRTSIPAIARRTAPRHGRDLSSGHSRQAANRLACVFH